MTPSDVNAPLSYDDIIFVSNNETLLTIHGDGKIEFNKKVHEKADDFAREFIKIVEAIELRKIVK